MASRREFILGAAAVAAETAVAGVFPRAEVTEPDQLKNRQPNFIVYLSDQFRWDFVGANGQNSSTRTPNLDAMATRGANFTHAVTNQPLCAPARSVVFTSRYATETNVWQNGSLMNTGLPTVANELRSAGYTANYIGKWHLAPETPAEGGSLGFVKPERRGGFLDLWEASNVLEFTSRPYEGSIFDGDGNEIKFKDQYRVDFLTDRAEKFLRQKHEKPFFLFVSQLEPHQQNDMKRIVGPNGSIERFKNAMVPPDLREFPGDWQEQFPDYYGACESIDMSVGRLKKVLEDEHLADNTVFIFMSDHGCHFMTRNGEYKRSTHNSSLRVPLLIDGPGFEGVGQIQEIVGLINLAPTILEIANVSAPASWRGRSLVPLTKSVNARQEWPNKELIQISESMTGRTIRTKDWTYCVAEPSGSTSAPGSPHYQEYQLYDQRADPYELVNLAGRKEYRQTAAHLREELKKLIVESGEAEPKITPAPLYP